MSTYAGDEVPLSLSIPVYAVVADGDSHLAVTAVAEQDPWIGELGPPPIDRHARQAWVQQAAVVAAYRDLYAVTGTRSSGAAPPYRESAP
jgi:hypothetical protein